ncbi:hypothetical protein BKH41_05090 [Helicobacter sp. 12S02232-10]|uniref:hypothetical protein n=1 Tax=Helicobacter sp. 12S02232-10 TaxID=1476197 RepID=UPI000BA50912|nr:hypothetical protein [Helicobacter sp. 12S02232-10]PAF48648.1 hypothetical protein BKH41_05090 [Helicobacter sp. 12S02232-10]
MGIKNGIERLIAIYNRYGMSISKFSSVIGKDRRTLTSWIDKTTSKEPSIQVKNAICTFFRYPKNIWDCSNEEFEELLNKVPEEQVRIIDEGYEGGLAYILDKEREERFVIHPRFPGPAYRDKIIDSPYKVSTSDLAKKLRLIRSDHILEYGFRSIEWYSIESLLKFAFSPIGNPYTMEQKIQILKLVYDTFNDNYNKGLYLFDSHSTKLYGMDTAYISINPKQKILFFKMPIDSLIVEICNQVLIDRLHRYFTSMSQTPKHILRTDSPKILSILLECIKTRRTLLEFYEQVSLKTTYGELFANNISVDLP